MNYFGYFFTILSYFRKLFINHEISLWESCWINRLNNYRIYLRLPYARNRIIFKSEVNLKEPIAWTINVADSELSWRMEKLLRNFYQVSKKSFQNTCSLTVQKMPSRSKIRHEALENLKIYWLGHIGKKKRTKYLLDCPCSGQKTPDYSWGRLRWRGAVGVLGIWRGEGFG